MTEIQFYIIVVILVVFSQLLLSIISFLKVNRSSPQLFKSISFFIIFILLQISFITSTYFLTGGLSNTNLSFIQFCIVTAILFMIYYLIDEDLFFRFDKISISVAMTALSIFTFLLWFFIIY
jgi:hypothetical protein